MESKKKKRRKNTHTEYVFFESRARAGQCAADRQNPYRNDSTRKEHTTDTLVCERLRKQKHSLARSLVRSLAHTLFRQWEQSLLCMVRPLYAQHSFTVLNQKVSTRHTHTHAAHQTIEDKSVYFVRCGCVSRLLAKRASERARANTFKQCANWHNLRAASLRHTCLGRKNLIIYFFLLYFCLAIAIQLRAHSPELMCSRFVHRK